jgi:CRP-like cAMP-binding protein
MIARMEIDALAELLGQTPVFRHLPLAARRELLGKSRLLACEYRTVLQRAGTPHHDLYLVIDGHAEMSASTREGDEIVVAIFGPLSFTSWIALFHDSPAERDLVAAPGSRLLAFPARPLLETLEAYPALYPQVLRLEAARFRAALDWQQQAAVADRTKRIASLLLLMAQISGEQEGSPRVAMTGEKLARIAQCSRETFRAALAELRAKGLVEQQYGAIVLLDRAGLKAFSDS